MNRLKDSICYLIGAIDDCENQGIDWRRDFIQKCNKKHGLGIKFLDPTNKLAGLQKEVGDEQNYINKLKQEQKWNLLKDFMKKVVRHDHRSIDLCDFIVMYIDTKSHMCGSYFELRSALSQKKPYFIITNGGKSNTPSWIFGIIDHNYIFDDVCSVVNKLKQIDDGGELSDRWVLIRDKLKEL